jgi:ankyrin repeat protein
MMQQSGGSYSSHPTYLYPTQHQHHHHESDGESYLSGPEFDEGENDEPTLLLSLVQAYDWAGVLARVTALPSEAQTAGVQGRTPLHVACDHDAPAVVIQALLKAYPEASTVVGTSNMNPLHITCSSHHASTHVIRVLLEYGKAEQTSMRDIDGDTALHAACRCGASREVLEVLLRANPSAVHERDKEGLTPLLRLWVRYFVILGDDAIEGVKSHGDLTGELGEAWNKTELLLHVAHHGALSRGGTLNVFRTVHAAAAVDCPRPVVKIAALVYASQLDQRDENGLTPLMIACETPIFKVRDLSDDGYMLEDVIYGDNDTQDQFVADDAPEQISSCEPSVIQILLHANQDAASSSACVPDPMGRLPLHLALESHKRWSDGLQQLVDVYPEALAIPDPTSKLVPFLLAAVGERADTSTVYEMLRLNPSLFADLKFESKNSNISTVPMETL